MKQFTRMALAVTCIGLGCASTKGVEDTQIAHMTVGQRQQVVEAQNRVNVAQANVTTAKQSLDEAKQFADISDKELKAASMQLEAAKQADQLGQHAHSGNTSSQAKRVGVREQAEVDAARAKKEYADRLVMLRKGRLDTAQGAFASEQANVELTKTQIAFEARNADRNALEKAQQNLRDARDKTNGAKAKAEALVGEVSNLQRVWTSKKKAYDVADRGAEPVVPAPAESPLLRQDQEKHPVRGSDPDAH